MINFQKLNLYRMFLTDKQETKTRLHAFSKKGASVFLDKASKILFQKILMSNSIGKDPLKFYMTDDTVKRLAFIPVEEDKLKGISRLIEKKGDTGFIFMNDKLHCLYAITASEVYIIVSSRVDIKSHSPDPEHMVNNICQSFIKVNLFDEKVYVMLNNPLDVLTNKESLLRKDVTYAKFLMKNQDMLVDSDSDMHKRYVEAFNASAEETKRCFQAFLFVYLSKVVDTTTISVDREDLSMKDRLLKGNTPRVDVVRVDTLYDENLKVINPFGVSGHFRNQPVGKDRAETKLIWIDDFMKSGYQRRATKDRLGI